MGLLDGRVALITGAARGQGRAHALRLAEEGAAVVAVDIADDISSLAYSLGSKADLEETARLVEAGGGRAIAVQGDVRSQEQLDAAVAAAIQNFGKIDICVANAGILSTGDFWDLTEEQWALVLDVNLSGVWRTAKAVTPHMMERRSGSIVVTGSINGLEPGPSVAHYTGAKHGPLGVMRTIALELAPYSVRCNAVCPGATDTRMIDNPVMHDQFHGGPGGSREDMERSAGNFHILAPANVIPPEAIANAVLYLASDLSVHVTGVHLPVDGGHMVLPGVNNFPRV